MLRRFLFLSAMLVAAIPATFAQSADPDSVKNEIDQITQVFDSTGFLSFDITTIASSDTAMGAYDNDREDTHYVLNGKKMYYKSGETEFAQDDSFAISASGTDHLLMVTRPVSGSNLRFFPMQEFRDSVLGNYFSEYDVTVEDTDGIRTMTFSTFNFDMAYKKIIITFFPENHLLNSIDYFTNGPSETEEQEDTLGNYNKPSSTDLSKHTSMKFDHYVFVQNDNICHYDSYIWYDQDRKEYLAIGKYKGYQVLTSNLQNTISNFNDLEVPAAPPPGAY